MSLHMQIGEVATQTGLSLRTIRYYDEVGLAPPSARTDGGFRLYTEADVARLLLIKRMKPLEFTLDEMRDLLDALDALDGSAGTEARRAKLLERISMYEEAARQRCARLRAQLEQAEAVADTLRKNVKRQRGNVKTMRR